MKQVTIYTDGACSGNPGPGGWGAILMYGAHSGSFPAGGSRYHQQPHGTDRRDPGAVSLEGALRCGALERPKYVIDGLSKGLG